MVANLDRYIDTEFGLDELVGVLRSLLQRAGPALSDGRVAELPDTRTLRYYQTIGILDKPLRYDGRRAVYGYRHLLQALSVKLLQGQGFSLAQIQRALTGYSREDLERAVSSALGVADEVTASADMIGTATDLQPIASAPRPAETESRALIAVEVGRGVSVVIDPAQIDSPEVILAAITELFKAVQGGFD